MDEKNVDTMNWIKNFLYAVIGKFTYEWAYLGELRLIILNNVTSMDIVKLDFHKKHILIHLSQHEDFINLISKGAFYIQ